MEDYTDMLSLDTPPGLTEWNNEPSISELKADLDSARPTQQAQMAKLGRWNDLLNVEGKAKPQTIKGRSSVQPKLIRRQAEWRYSALTEPFLGSNKMFTVNPVTFEDEEAASQNELLINWQFRTKLNKVKLVDDMVRSTVDEGTCILRTGWHREVRMVKEMVPIYEMYPPEDEEFLQILEQVLMLKESNPREYDETVPEELKESVEFYLETEQPAMAVMVGEEEVETEELIENRPIVEVAEPGNIYIDPTCEGDLDKALYVIASFETYKAELEKDKDRYKNLKKVNWEGNSPYSTPNHVTRTPSEAQFKDDARKKVTAYEYWGYYDIQGDGNLVPIVATWIGDVIIRLERNPFPDGKPPFVVIPYLPVKRQLYGEPDAELLEDNQRILGAVTRGVIDLLGRSANSQQGFAKGILDPINRRKYERGEDYEFNPMLNPTSHIIEHKYPDLPGSALDVMAMQNQEAEALTGVKSFSGGVSGEAYGDVAAGIRGMLDAASKREMAILRRLAKGMTEVGMKIVAMNAVFLADEEVVRVTNRKYVEIKREDLAGHFDMEVDIATAEVDDAKSNDLSFMLQTIGPNIDSQITLQILGEIADLKRMPALAERLRTFQPEPSEEEQEMMQLDLEEKRLRVEKLRSEVEVNQAKARELLSKADQTDLDYVEQETGTKHARDLERQKAQSEGNQNLQITKALATPRKDNEGQANIDAAIGYNMISGKLNEALANTTSQRDELAQEDPRYSIGSQYYDPSLDPAANPALNI